MADDAAKTLHGNEELIRRRAAELETCPLPGPVTAGLFVFDTVLDDHGEIVDWILRDANDEALKDFGLPRERLMNRRVTELFGSESPQIVHCQLLREVMSTGRGRQFEAHYPWDDKHFLISVLPLSRSTLMTTAMDVTESKRAEEARQEAKQKLEWRVAERTAELQAAHTSLAEQSRYLEAFFSHAITPLAFLDRDFNFIRVNEAYARADRRDVDEFPGRNHFAFYPSDAKAIFEEVVRTRQSFQAVARPFVYAGHPDWGVTYWDWTLTPVLDEGGEVEILVFALQDVTERRRAEIELEKHHEHLEELIQERTRELAAANARLQAEMAERTETEKKLIYLASFPERNPSPVMEVDQDGQIRYANPAALRLFPDLCEQGPAHPWLADWTAVAFTLHEGQTDTGVRDLTIGERCYRQTLHYFPQEGFVRIYGFDITERKRAEEELTRAREEAERKAAELQTVLDAVPAAVWITQDPECRKITGNQASYEILRLPPGVNASKSAPEGERPETFRVFKDGRELEPEEMPVQRAAGGASIRDFEFDFVFLDGTGRHMFGNAVPLHDAGGKPRGSVAAFVDITEHKQAEEALRESEERYHALADELREADRHKNDFLAVLSHELRNPLASIQNSLHILDRAAPGGEQARRAKAVIHRQFGQLTHLVDDLLDLTRITQNKIHLQKQRLELNEVVRRTIEDHQTLCEQNGVCLAFAPASAPIFVQAEEARLAQVVGNLLQNAAKFTSRGGRIRVSVAGDPAGKAVIRVTDTGAGMPPEILPRLFQPFVQAETTLDRSRGGLGLGLALSKGLVELHGGEISASSAGPGQGSEFVVHLPLAEALVEEPQDASPAESPRRRRRILIIEDNVDLAESLRELLELDGHEIEVAFGGPDGVAKAREFRPEVLLCDIGLPGMDGYAVARAFRADEKLKDVFLVAMTGYAQTEDREQAAAAGFDRHLAKPPDLEELERMLAGI